MIGPTQVKTDQDSSDGPVDPRRLTVLLEAVLANGQVHPDQRPDRLNNDGNPRPSRLMRCESDSNLLSRFTSGRLDRAGLSFGLTERSVSTAGPVDHNLLTAAPVDHTLFIPAGPDDRPGTDRPASVLAWASEVASSALDREVGLESWSFPASGPTIDRADSPTLAASSVPALALFPSVRPGRATKGDDGDNSRVGLAGGLRRPQSSIVSHGRWWGRARTPSAYAIVSGSAKPTPSAQIAGTVGSTNVESGGRSRSVSPLKTRLSIGRIDPLALNSVRPHEKEAAAEVRLSIAALGLPPPQLPAGPSAAAHQKPLFAVAETDEQQVDVTGAQDRHSNHHTCRPVTVTASGAAKAEADAKRSSTLARRSIALLRLRPTPTAGAPTDGIGKRLSGWGSRVELCGNDDGNSPALTALEYRPPSTMPTVGSSSLAAPAGLCVPTAAGDLVPPAASTAAAPATLVVEPPSLAKRRRPSHFSLAIFWKKTDKTQANAAPTDHSTRRRSITTIPTPATPDELAIEEAWAAMRESGSDMPARPTRPVVSTCPDGAAASSSASSTAGTTRPREVVHPSLRQRVSRSLLPVRKQASLSFLRPSSRDCPVAQPAGRHGGRQNSHPEIDMRVHSPSRANRHLQPQAAGRDAAGRGRADGEVRVTAECSALLLEQLGRLRDRQSAALREAGLVAPELEQDIRMLETLVKRASVQPSVPARHVVSAWSASSVTSVASGLVDVHGQAAKPDDNGVDAIRKSVYANEIRPVVLIDPASACGPGGRPRTGPAGRAVSGDSATSADSAGTAPSTVSARSGLSRVSAYSCVSARSAPLPVAGASGRAKATGMRARKTGSALVPMADQALMVPKRPATATTPYHHDHDHLEDYHDGYDHTVVMGRRNGIGRTDGRYFHHHHNRSHPHIGFFTTGAKSRARLEMVDTPSVPSIVLVPAQAGDEVELDSRADSATISTPTKRVDPVLAGLSTEKAVPVLRGKRSLARLKGWLRGR